MIDFYVEIAEKVNQVEFDNILEIIVELPVKAHNRAFAIRALFDGRYTVHHGGPLPAEYEEYYSEVCWGWLVVAKHPFRPIAVSYGHGECGNDVYDPFGDGLHIWML